MRYDPQFSTQTSRLLSNGPQWDSIPRPESYESGTLTIKPLAPTKTKLFETKTACFSFETRVLHVVDVNDTFVHPAIRVYFREGFRRERVKLAEEIERLENELALMKVTLQKEMEYKDNMEKSHHSLLAEQRDLQSQWVSLPYLTFGAGAKAHQRWGLSLGPMRNPNRPHEEIS